MPERMALEVILLRSSFLLVNGTCVSNVQKFIVSRHPYECGPEERPRKENISSINTASMQLLNIMHKRNSLSLLVKLNIL